MKNLVAALLILSTASPVFAKIGDTPEQAVKKYGKPVDTTTRPPNFPPEVKTAIYRTDKFVIIEGYYKEKSVAFSIMKMQDEDGKDLKTFTQKEIIEVLALNAPDEKFKPKYVSPLKNPENLSVMTSLNHVATVTPEKTLVTISSMEFEKLCADNQNKILEESKKRAEERKRKIEEEEEKKAGEIKKL